MTKEFTVKMVLGVLSLGLFAIGIWDVLFNFEKNLCQMTYMFESPNYVPVPLSEFVVDDFPNYGLYVYSEGGRTVQYQRSHFTGIPVLFIPGNAGSYRQSRSLGSVLLRMSEKRQNGVRFDVFTVDFNEEFAGLYGGFLAKQTDFVLQCMLKISSLYGKKETKVILVGHSVGGMIARGLFLKPSFETASVQTIFTLSTPHQPVLIVDEDFEEFYEKVDVFWSKSANTTLKDVVMVSLAGGHRDVLVRSDRSDLSGILGRNRRFISVTTTSVPAVWASTDHLCIVWCKQLIISMAKALFEMADIKTKHGLVDSVQRRTDILSAYFINPTSKVTVGEVAEVESQPNANIHFEKHGPLKLLSKKFQPVSHHAFSLEAVEGDVVLLSNRWMRRWIRLCRDPFCNESVPVSIEATRLPWFSEDPHFYAVIPGDVLKKGKFLLFQIAKSDDVISLQVEETPAEALTPTITFGSALKAFFGMGEGLKISGKAYLRLNVQLTQLWEALNVGVLVLGKCPANRGVMRFSVPGFVQDTYKLMDQPINYFPLKLQTAVSAETSSSLEFFLNSDCVYQIDLAIGWTDIAGQLVRFYGAQIPAFFAAVVLVQMAPLYREKTSTLWDHLLVNAIVAFFLLAAGLISDLSWLDVGLAGASLPTSIILWIIFYTIAFSMVSLLETALIITVSLYSYPVHFVAKPVLRRLQFFQNRRPAWFQKVLVFPLFAAAATALSYATCGENGILLALSLYFVKVCYHRRNQLVANSVSSFWDVGESTKILLLAVLVTMCNVVPTLVWTKQLPADLLELLKSSHGRLDPDPSFALAVGVGILLDFSNRSHVRRLALTRARNFLEFLMEFFIFVLAAALLLFAQRAFHMVNFFLSILLTLMSCDFLRKAFTESQPLATTA